MTYLPPVRTANLDGIEESGRGLAKAFKPPEAGELGPKFTPKNRPNAAARQRDLNENASLDTETVDLAPQQPTKQAKNGKMTFAELAEMAESDEETSIDEELDETEEAYRPLESFEQPKQMSGAALAAAALFGKPKRR